MPNQTIPLQLPDAIYQRLQQVAHATNHSVEEVLLQTIRANLLLHSTISVPSGMVSWPIYSR